MAASLSGGWINQCVGHQNHRYFILFLYSAVQVCWYGTFLIYRIFESRMYDSPMYKFLVATQRLEYLGHFHTYQIFMVSLARLCCCGDSAGGPRFREEMTIFQRPCLLTHLTCSHHSTKCRRTSHWEHWVCSQGWQGW